jgi:hypothetical protein
MIHVRSGGSTLPERQQSAPISDVLRVNIGLTGFRGGKIRELCDILLDRLFGQYADDQGLSPQRCPRAVHGATSSNHERGL